MFPTPTPLPIGATPPIDTSALPELLTVDVAVQAVGWWRLGLETTGVWADLSAVLLAAIAIAATVAIIVHLTSVFSE